VWRAGLGKSFNWIASYLFFKLVFYEDIPECPARKGGDEWHTSNAPPLVGGARGGGKSGIFTPTLILPHQGGGDIF